MVGHEHERGFDASSAIGPGMGFVGSSGMQARRHRCRWTLHLPRHGVTTGGSGEPDPTHPAPDPRVAAADTRSAARALGWG